jgi:Zn ribbon nucleic-acid-binding protein
VTTTTKKPKTGGEIDAFCTKCKMDLGHRIIAMVEDRVKKVECRTCGSHHLYRRPKAERDAAHARMAERAEGRKIASGGGTKAERATRAEKAERDHIAAWEHAIAGKPSSAFTAYRVTLTFGQGDLVHHTKFGDGVVARIIDQNKIEVLFKEGTKTMAQNVG